VLTFVDKVNDWNEMREEIELKKETLELWRLIGREKGSEEEIVVVDMDMVIGYNTKTSLIDELK
jgi:hypothetical protein